MEQVHPAEVILALKPLLESTPRSPRTSKTPTKIETGEDARAYLEDVVTRAEWVKCPACTKEWNSLAPDGVCIACVDQQHADAKHQRELGELLVRTIGKYGIETYSFQNFQITADNNYAYRRMKAFDYRKENLFIFGPCGTGKTHLAGALLKQACADNLNVRWINPMYVSRLLKSNWPSEEERIVDRFIKQDVLIIDDLGVGRDTELTLRLIYEICDKRKANKQNGLVITSNQSLEKLAESYRDDRIMSRITGLCRVISIKGPDGRLQPVLVS